VAQGEGAAVQLGTGGAASAGLGWTLWSARLLAYGQGHGPAAARMHARTHARTHLSGVSSLNRCTVPWLLEAHSSGGSTPAGLKARLWMTAEVVPRLRGGLQRSAACVTRGQGDEAAGQTSRLRAGPAVAGAGSPSPAACRQTCRPCLKVKDLDACGSLCTRMTVPCWEADASRPPSWFQAMAACRGGGSCGGGRALLRLSGNNTPSAANGIAPRRAAPSLAL
jgi:hypothetical protein